MSLNLLDGNLYDCGDILEEDEKLYINLNSYRQRVKPNDNTYVLLASIYGEL